jgi:CHAD domain-containing protein
MALAEAAFASNSIAKLLERLAYQVGATAHSMSAENVHDLRVAVRRFEQSLALFRQALPGREVKHIRRKLKALMDRAGDVRDCDMAQKILLKCDLPAVADLKKRLAEERREALPGLAAALRRWSARRTSAKWRASLLPVEARDGFHHHLPKLARKFLAHGDAAARAKVSAAVLHAFRIEGKKLRYTLELLAPSHPAAARQWVEKLKPIQSALGDVHDCRMARDVAARFDAPAEIQEWLKRCQRRKTRDFRKLWEESFGEPAVRRALVAGLRHTPRKPMGRSTRSQTAAARQA